MLKANKKRWFEKVFFVYNRNLLNRRFHSFQVSGLENLMKRKVEIPTIIYCNHSSWWDGLVAFHINRQTKLDGYWMMEENQLKNLQPFRKLGAFSVVKESPREVLKSINYSVRLLKEKKNRAIWIFPQGEIMPNDLRPIKFYNGISRIVEKAEKCQLFCVAMRYEFLGNFKPDIFINIKESEIIKVDEHFDSKVFMKKLSDKLTENLAELKNYILENNLKDFSNII